VRVSGGAGEAGGLAGGDAGEAAIDINAASANGNAILMDGGTFRSGRIESTSLEARRSFIVKVSTGARFERMSARDTTSSSRLALPRDCSASPLT
jgi:hypothetical protein